MFSSSGALPEAEDRKELHLLAKIQGDLHCLPHPCEVDGGGLGRKNCIHSYPMFEFGNPHIEPMAQILPVLSPQLFPSSHVHCFLILMALIEGPHHLLPGCSRQLPT